MTVTYNNTLRLADLATGTEVGTWGELTDTNICTLLTQAVAGYTGITLPNNATDYVLSALNGQPDEARSAVLGFGGTLNFTKNIIIPNAVKLYHVFNWTSGTIVLKPTAGTGVSIPSGTSAIVWCDGINTASFLASALNNYLPRTGGVLSNQLVVQNGGLVVQATYSGGTSNTYIQAYPGQNAILYLGNINSMRWLVYMDAAAETGGNAGSNFQIAALNDGGGWINTVFHIIRQNQYVYLYSPLVSMSGSLQVNGNQTTSGNLTVGGNDSSFTHNIAVGGNTGLQNTWINGTLYGRGDGWLYVGNSTHFYGDTQVDGTINCSHNGNFAGDVHCNAVYAPAGLFAGTDTDMGVFRGPNNRYMQMAGNWHWNWQNADGLLGWVRGGSFMWVMRAADNLCYAQLGPVGGYGGYLNFSDQRAKTNVAPSQRGLDAILQLQPVEFTRVHGTMAEMPVRYPARRELGFVAQAVKDIIPEAVVTVGIELADGSGGLNSTNPSLGVDSDAIIAAMVNAIKTLATRVATLEARRA